MKICGRIRKTVFSFVVSSILFVEPLLADGEKGNGELDLELEELINVEITVASKKTENVNNASGVITVISHDEIRRSGAVTLKELLWRIPSMGIAVNAMSNRTVPVMRGDMIKTNSSHILFLLNGRPVREVQEGGVNSDLVETFPVNCIDRIEVIRGPGSVLYGSDAFSGVVNILTEIPDDKLISASAGVHYETGNGGGATGKTAVKSGDFEVVAAARYHDKPDWENRYKLDVFMTDSSFPSSVTVDTVVEENRGTGVFLNVNYRGLSLMGSFLDWNTNGYQMNNDIDNTKYFVNAGYKCALLDFWKSELNVSGTRTELTVEDFVSRESNSMLIENTHFFTLAEKLNLVVGGTSGYTEGREKILPSIFFARISRYVSDGNRWIFSGYGQIDYTFRDVVKILSGVQINKTPKVKAHIAPRIGALWFPYGWLSMKALYSEAFRLPSINELFMHFDGVIYGDEHLRPEIVKTFDLGLTVNNNKMLAGINFFHSRQEDIIQQLVLPDSGVSQYTNRGTVTFIGGELEGKYYLTRDILLTMSLLYQENHDSSSYRTVPYPDFGIKGGISYSNDRGITLSLFDVYQGDVADRFKGILNRKENQGPFNILDFSAQFDIFRFCETNRRIQPALWFKINNIFGKEVWMFEHGTYTNEVIPAIRGREYLFGCTITL